MPKKKFVIAVFLASIFFIPIGINELYKAGAGYVTVWGAADVLSYYGTILGAITTVGALIVTISFTRKQIERENFIKNESEKWSKIEAIFIRALDDINPMRPLMTTMHNGLLNPSDATNELQRYQISSKVATDQLNAYLNIIDYPKVESLVNGINSAIEQFDKIAQEQVEAYSKLSNLLSIDTAKKTLDMEASFPGSFPVDTLSFCQKILNDTKGLCKEDIIKAIGQLREKMAMAYQSTYRNLLQLKGSTFEQINTDIQKRADAILFLWGEK